MITETTSFCISLLAYSIWNVGIRAFIILTIETDHQEGRGVLGALGNSINDLLLQPATVLGLVGRVLGQLGRPNNEADFGERAIGSGGVEGIKTHEGHTLLGEGRVLACLLELIEPGQGVVVEVVGILVELPRDTRFLIELVDGLPLQRVAVDSVAVAA
jgi:hypothetical protein